MHELQVARSICDTVTAHLGPADQVVSVVVEYGPLSGIAPLALDHCFSFVAEDAGLGAARLDLRLLTARAACRACDASFEVTSMWDRCPRCGYAPVTVEGGRELRVREIEVEENTGEES